MKKQGKRLALILMLAAVMTVICACHENPPADQLYQKLFSHFEDYGFTCELRPVDGERPVPIYRASAWQSLMLGGEEVLLYFDDSNRADYLSSFVDEEAFGKAWRFGLRFVLVYGGADADVLEALNAIENE